MISAALTRVRSRFVDLYLDHFAAAPAVSTNWTIDRAELTGLSVRWPRSYEWHAASDWVSFLRNGLGRYVPVEIVDDIPQPYKGTVIFQLVVDGDPKTIAVGYSDYIPIDERCASSADLYFKMQFDANGYSRRHVVPGGYVPDGKRLYYHLPRLRRTRDARHFRYDVYGRFSLNYAREIREEAVNKLRSQDRFGFEGGMQTVSYDEFLDEVTRSKVCLDLPGLGDFCFRLVNYLSVGTCVIAYPHRTSMHVPLVDREHIVYCKSDLSDVVDLCEYYLQKDDERERIARNAREYFDRYLHKDNLVRYYLRTCIDRLQSRS